MRPKPEPSELEDLKDLLRSRGYDLLRNNLARMIESRLRDLVKPSDAETTSRLRGEILGLEAALNAPIELQRQIKATVERAK